MTSPAVKIRFSRPDGPLPIRHLLYPVVLVVVSVVAGVAFAHPTLIRPVLLLAAIPAVIGVGLLAPSRLIYVLAVWLVALGLVRRLMDTTAPSGLGGLGDPLLLVEPAIMVVLVAVAWQKGAFRGRTRLANAVLVLTVMAAVEVVNPLQGSPLVGIAGALFILVPILAFWVGRALVDDDVLRRLFRLVAVLALAAVGYGLLQQFRGLPSWDAAWVRSSGYAALNVGGTIRAFGTFSSAAEYASFLGIGLAICAAAFTKRAVFPVALVAACLLGYGIFDESSRGIVVLAVAAMALMLAARLGLRPAFALMTGILGLLALSAVAGHFASSAAAASAPGAALVQHQVQGLANPFNSQVSTLNVHFSQMVDGFRSAFTVPVGHGTGSVTIAASRYGGTVKGTEVDPSNVGVALGLPGLAAYLVVVVLGLLRLYRAAAITRTWWTLAALGVVVATFLQWTNGGQYATAWLPWLVLGWVDRNEHSSHDTDRPVDSRDRHRYRAWAGNWVAPVDTGQKKTAPWRPDSQHRSRHRSVGCIRLETKYNRQEFKHTLDTNRTDYAYLTTVVVTVHSLGLRTVLATRFADLENWTRERIPEALGESILGTLLRNPVLALAATATLIQRNLQSPPTHP